MTYTRRLGDLVTLTSGQSPSAFKFGSSGVPYFKVDQLGRSAKFLSRNETPYCATESPHVPAGSVLIAKRGGSIALNRVRLLSEPGFMDTNVMALTPNDELDSEYLYHWLSHRGLWDIADVTSVPQINNKHIIPLEIPLPSYREQVRVAGSLGDADRHISTLELLIAKKQALKQGMMQQLLVEDAAIRPLFSLLGRLTAGISVNSAAEQGMYSILKTSCVSGGVFIPTEKKTIVQEEVRRAKVNPAADSLIVSRMNTPNLVGEVGYISQDWPSLYLPDRLWLATKLPDAQVNMRWLGYALSFPRNSRRIKDLATGTSGSMKNIAKGSFLNFLLATPSLERQDSIVSVLTDADDEISALQSRLAKARAIKQGMMQQLLTGKIRLPVPDSTTEDPTP